MSTTISENRLSNSFWRLFSAYSVNAAGDEFYAVAVPLALLATGYPQYTVTFLFGVLTAAMVIGGFVLGFMADRWRTHQLLASTYLMSAATLALGAVLIMAGAGGFAIALAVATVLGVLAAISAAGVDAGIPRALRDTAQIKQGYSLVESSRTVATVAGPALAGIAAAVSNLVAIFALNAASFTVAAGVMMSGLRSVHGGHKDGRERPPSAGSPIRMVVEGTAGIIRNPTLRSGIALSFTLNIALGAEQPMFLARLVTEMGLSSIEASLVMTVAGVVSIVAALIFSAVRTSVPARVSMVAASAVTALTAIGVGLTLNPLLSAICYCVLCASTVYYNVSWRTYRQGIVAPELLGRVSASCRSIAYLGVVMGAAAAGTLQGAGLSTSVLC